MDIAWHTILGVLALAIAATMVLIGRPNKYGESPQFMQHPVAVALYPVTALTFLAYGVVELVVTYLAIRAG